MKIYTRIEYRWDGDKLVLDNYDAFEYSGNVELCCGATDAQNAAQAAQASAYTQMTQQAAQVFGDSSAVFKQLQATFTPTIAAGPNQEGFSPAEVSALKSQAITQSGNAYRNAKQAVGESIAAEGGGNNSALQSGTNTGINLSVANSAAANTADEENKIDLANYSTGRTNYANAVAGLSGATGVYNPATSSANASTTAGEASANTANQIASQNNSWQQGVIGALGGIGGAFVSGGLKSLGGAASSASDSTADGTIDYAGG